MMIFSEPKSFSYAEVDEFAAHADGGERFDKVFKKFVPFLRRTALEAAANANASFDDMYELVTVAFYQAVRAYSLGKGSFTPFMKSVVKRRVIDNIRKSYAKKVEMVFHLDEDEEDDEDRPAAVSSAVNSASIKAYHESERQKELKYEVQAFMDEIKIWGFSMKQLVAHSPKQDRLREIYDTILQKIVDDEEIMGTIWAKRYYPVKNIAQLTKIPLKIISRSRIFIIAQIILLRGDYSNIRTYVKFG